MSEPERNSWLLRFQGQMMKREENMRLLHAKTVSSKNKACGQKWKIKNWQKKKKVKSGSMCVCRTSKESITEAILMPFLHGWTS